MPTLFIRLLSPVIHSDEGFQLGCEWAIVEDDGSERAHGVTDYHGLGELIDPSVDWLNDPENLVVLAPGEQVLGISCEVPGRSTAQIKRALPFVVEEFVATDIEGMHLASGPIKRGEPTRCNLIERSVLADWLECLRELRLEPGYLISETELLANEVGQVSVLFEGDRVLVKTTEQSATLDRDNLLLALGAVDASEILLINGTLTDLERGQLDDAISVTEATGAESTLGYLIARFRDLPQVINLLQGDYEPIRHSNPSWTRWRAVAALVGIWVAVGFVAMLAEGFWSSSQAKGLEADAEGLYREIFPSEQRVVNARRQMQTRLGISDPTDADFMDYLGQLAQAASRSSSVLSLNYTDTRDELAADLLVRNFDELDKLKRDLENKGVTVDITSAEQQDANVRARIRLGRG